MMKRMACFLVAAALCAGFLTGCAASKPTADQSAKLEQSRAAAEAATKELHDLRVQKARLEAEKGR